MSKPQMTPMTPVNSFVVPPNGPPPNTIPYQLQSNMNPGQNEYSSIPPWNVTQAGQHNFPSMTTPQWNAQPGMTAQSNQNFIIPQPADLTSWLRTFEKGKPKALGILLIIMAICQIPLGIALPLISIYGVTFYSGVEYWAPLFIITAGSLTISAQKRQSIAQVKASFGFNIVSSIVSLAGMIINIVDFAVVYCDPYYGCYPYFYPSPSAPYIILGFLLFLNLLVFCVTVSLAVFGGRALDRLPSNVPPVFVIQNMVPVPLSGYPPNSSELPVPSNPYAQK